MVKRSFSDIDLDTTELDSSQHSGVVQKRQKTASKSIFSRFVDMFSLFTTRPSPNNTKPLSTTPQIYPALPKAYIASSPLIATTSSIKAEERSHTLNSKEAEGLSRANPISLVDDEDESSESQPSGIRSPGPNEAGPSRPWADFPDRHTSRTPGNIARPTHRKRPQISAEDAPKRFYGWQGLEKQSYSPKAEQRKKQAVSARQSKIEKRPSAHLLMKAKAATVMKSVKMTFGRRMENEFQKANVTDGPEAKEFFRQQILENEKASFEEQINAPKPTYTPDLDRGRKAQALNAQRAPAEELDVMLSRIRLQKETADRRAEKLLKVSIPSSLSDEEEDIVDEALADEKFEQAFVKVHSLRRLEPAIWLDDEIINHYGTMIQNRSQNDKSGKLPKVWYFTSHFFEKMKKPYDKSFGRWTKKVNIFEQDRILMPLNVGGNHWTSTIINLEHKRVEYYDSMGGTERQAKEVFDNVTKYLRAEHLAKLGTPYDTSDWTYSFFARKTPQQTNGSDCGIFTCQTLEAASRGKDLVNLSEWDFKAKNMPFFRRLMVYEIAKDKLYKRW